MRTTRRALWLLALLASSAAGEASTLEAAASGSMTQGKLAVDLGDLAAAERLFASVATEAAASERERAEALVRLGAVRRALGKTLEGASAFQGAIDSPARDSEVTRLLALALAGVAPDRRSWEALWPRVRFAAQSSPARRQPVIRWPGVPPADVKVLFPSSDPVTLDVEDVPLNSFLHHFLLPWRPGVESSRSWPGPRSEAGFEAWPEPYEPPAAVQHLDFVIHSGIKRPLAAGSTGTPEPLITVKVSGLSWSEVFQNVLASNGLGFALEGKVLFVARTEDLAAFDRIRGRSYAHLPISLNFMNGDLRDLFRLFADVTGFHIAPDDDLPGSFTAVVTERPAMEVFDLLLAANDLAATRIPAPDGNPGTTALRIRRLAAVGGDAVDVSQLPSRLAAPRPAAVEPRDSASVKREVSGGFTLIEGLVQVKAAGARAWTAARPDTRLSAGDAVRTGPGGRANIRWADGTVHHMKEDSLIVVDKASEAGKVGVTRVPGRPYRAEDR